MVVYLRGRVRTKQQRTLIEQIALPQPGVKKVVSAIDVDDAAGYWRADRRRRRWRRSA